MSAVAPGAAAEVSFEGDWPATEKIVSLSVEKEPRAAVIRELAEQAGWSVVLEASPEGNVDLLVERQPADKVLEALLREGSWIAHREGDLVSVARHEPAAKATVSAPSAPLPPSPAVAPPSAAASSKRGKDRFVAGSSLTIHAGETVKDLVVLGGAAEVLGTVTGDLAVFGGTATVRSGGRVMGDCVVFGGSLNVDAGGSVDGDQAAFGGDVRQDGEVVEEGIPLHPDWDHRPAPWTGPHIAARIAQRTASSAMLFLFGAVLLALASQRMESLQVAFAARPLRSLLQGFLAFLLLVLATVLLVVTCIGIPIAAALLLGSLFAANAGLCAILATVGTALIQHRSQNPYVHLAVGCALYLVVGMVPFAGGFATFLLGLMGLGTVVLTRGAGLWPVPAR
ncbi:MAG: hypothetical protein JW751_14475 [Polyangiaceae bacterium]|nr:hypothetical protein [Polyangiaceae bacterium]